MEAAVPFPVAGSAGYSIPDWRDGPKVGIARAKMMEIILKSLPLILRMAAPEAVEHVAAVEEELFYQSNSFHDYIDTKTLPERLRVAYQGRLEHNRAAAMAKNSSHAVASHLFGSQFDMGSFLPQQTWARYPASAKSYWQDGSGSLIISGLQPPLATNPAAHLVSHVGFLSGSTAFLDPPNLVSLVGSSNDNAIFCNPSLPPHCSSVFGEWTPPNDRQAPYGPLFNSNLVGGQYSRDRHGDNITNVLDNPWADQSGASARKYHQGRSNGVTIHPSPPHLGTYPTENQVFAAGSSRGSNSVPSCAPYNSLVDGGWAITQNRKRGGDGLPCSKYSSGIPGDKYLQSRHGDDILHYQDVPLSSEGVGDDYIVSSGGTPCSKSGLSHSPFLPINRTVSGTGFSIQDGKNTRHGPTLGIHSSESATHQLFSTEKSVPGWQYMRGISGEHIVQDHEATPTSAAIVGVENLFSHAGASYGISSVFRDCCSQVVGTVNGGGFSLEEGKEYPDGLSPGNGSLQSEAAIPQPIPSAEQCRQDLQGVISNIRNCESMMEDLPAPVASIVGTSDVSDLLKKHEWANESLPSLQHSSESLLPDVPVLNKSAVIKLTDDDKSQINPEVGPVHIQEIPGFITVDDSKIDPSLEEPLICYELKVPAEVELMDEDEFMPNDNLEAHGFSKETEIPIENENTRVQLPLSEEKPEDEILEKGNICCKSSKTESSDRCRVSMTESLSEEKIWEHLSSLGNSIRTGSRDEAMVSSSENICCLCGEEKLFFEMAPCSHCGTKIKKSGVYYSVSDKEGGLTLCQPCYNRCGKKINCGEKTYIKEKLHKETIKRGTEEDWVQCDKCRGWQHQICTLYNQVMDIGGEAEYTCPWCCLKEIRSGERLPSEAGVLSASNLPRTALSDHIEQRLLTRLREDRELRAKGSGKGFLEVPGAEDLTIRVVQTEKKKLKVKDEFLDLFKPTDYPSEFPYTSKMILLFQKIGVADVILFGFYAEEYGSDCGDPNSRCIYISYLDSIKYFWPSVSSATGEALRTFAYHEILIGYLDYCKKRGFVSCHLWSCPPRRGQDYLFHNHPENQQTPTAHKLTNWYQTMIQKAIKEKVVVHSSNVYDCHFRAPSGSRYPVSATRLPYFEGDSWFNFAENVLKEVNEESKSDYQRKRVKTGTKHKVNAIQRTDTLYDSKDFLFMQKLGRIIQPDKKDFIVMHLRHVCSQCHHPISSGQGWFCNGCTDFRLCERCHDDENSVADSHRSNKGKRHSLSKVAVDILPSSTDDKDGPIDNLMLRNRHRFLMFCQKKHYQFDTLRRAKHSSMMVLHFLSCPNYLSECSICSEISLSEECWMCEICPDLRVCPPCHEQRGFSHCHPVTCGSKS